MTASNQMTISDPNWNELAAAYANAADEPARWQAFEAIREWVGADLPEDADDTEGAITFLRGRGLWND